MKIHFQGVALLLGVMLLLLGVAKWAAPTLHDALGPNGAIQATSSPDIIPGSPEALANLPLSSAEVITLQSILDSIDYNVGGVDGIMGPKSRAAAAQAKLDLKLAEGTSNRKLLELLILLTTNN